jgi:hypothetical protein
MRRLDVLGTRCLEVAAKGKSNLADATVAEAAIRDCAGLRYSRSLCLGRFVFSTCASTMGS